MIVPLIIGLLIMPSIQDCFRCCFKQEQNANQVGPNNNNQPVVLILNNDNQQDDEEAKYNEVQRTTTNKAMDKIMNNWRRKFSIHDKAGAESCCVCLDEFNEGENIIELR